MINFITKTLIDLLSIDTRTKENNETEAALYVKKELDKNSIWSKVIEPVSGKGSVLAYMPGKSKEKSNLLLLSHLDTADYGNLGDWYIDPRKGSQYKNRIFGRGAIDCKGLVALWMGLLVYLKTNNIILERGIVFAATADEERGGEYGSKYLINNYDLIKDCKFVLSEGGGVPIEIAGSLYYLCQVGEKGKLKYSISRDDGKGLLGGRERIIGRLNKDLIESSKDMYDIYRLFKDLYGQSKNNTSRRIDHEDILSNSVNIYRKQEDYIMEIDYLPDTKMDCIINSIRKMYKINLEDNNLIQGVPAHLSSTDTKLYRIIENQTSKYFEKARIIPYITPGYSDNRLFREQGKTVYGYFPIDLSNSVSGIHGCNEYISHRSLEIGFDLLRNIIMEFCQMST